MEQQIVFTSVETKSMKSGKPYRVFKSNDGVYSCFEEKVYSEIERNLNNLILVDVLDKGAFKNVKAFNKVLSGTPQQAVPTSTAQPQPVVAQALAMEKPIKISLSQSAKGFTYISEVTIRVDTIDEACELLDEAMALAENKVAEMNIEPAEATQDGAD